MTAQVNWLLLINAILGQFVAGLSARIFMISLPSVARGLETDILGISWALISFQLAGISLSVVFGRLGDIYGRGAVFGLGFVVLTISSFLCGISQNVLQLIVFRFLQGIGGAMTQSSGRALAMDATPEGTEGKVQGIMTAAFHTGFLIGPPLGGFIIDYVNWRGIFLFLVPIGVVGIALSAFGHVQRASPKSSSRRPAVDYAGAGFLILLTLMLTLLLDRRAAQFAGIGQRGFLALAFAGALWGFLAHESRAPSPMVDLALFRIRMFTCSILSLVLLSVTRGFVGFLMPFYLQDILDLSPSFMGVLFLASPIFTLSLAPMAGHLTDRIGPRIPASMGVLVSIAVVLIGTTLRVNSHWILPTAMLALTGIGTAFFNSANQAAIIGSVPKAHRGFATGMVHTAFDLGHMLGVSVSGFLMAVSFQYFSGVPGSMPDPKDSVVFVSSLNTSYAAALLISLLALVTSMMRGGGRIMVVS